MKDCIRYLDREEVEGGSWRTSTWPPFPWRSGKTISARSPATRHAWKIFFFSFFVFLFCLESFFLFFFLRFLFICSSDVVFCFFPFFMLRQHEKIQLQILNKNRTTGDKRVDVLFSLSPSFFQFPLIRSSFISLRTFLIPFPSLLYFHLEHIDDTTNLQEKGIQRASSHFCLASVVKDINLYHLCWLVCFKALGRVCSPDMVYSDLASIYLGPQYIFGASADDFGEGKLITPSKNEGRLGRVCLWESEGKRKKKRNMERLG